MAPVLRRFLRCSEFPAYPHFHTQVGVIPKQRKEPQTPPAGPEVPGDFVSEELRADCLRFLVDLRAMVVRRAEMLGGATDHVPPDEDVGTPRR